MSPTHKTRRWWPLAIMLSSLMLAGCFSSDSDSKGDPNDPKKGSGEVFHGAEWATIKDLDPRGEGCVECHGRNNDMSPFGEEAHNLALKNNDTPEKLGVDGLEIVSAEVDEESGTVTVEVNQDIPADANLSMTFAKLAPRVIHDRGHDWQNYFASNALGFGENMAGAENMMLVNGGVQPQTVPDPQVDGKTITFNLGAGDGRDWGEHDFKVKSAYEDDTDTWQYNNILGTKFNMVDIGEHVYCDPAHDNANQILADDETKPVCWWPDGTHLTSGVFATVDNEFIVAYEPDYTHRVTIIIGGSPGYNTWYDFVPATGDAFDAASYLPTDGDGKHENQSEAAAREIVDIQSCNSCHDSLSMHGGSRATTQTCVTCHNPGNLQASSGRSVDFKQLIHRIHRGENLPSEAEDIADKMADGKSLVASHATDFTKVRFPQGSTPGSPEGITNCVKCHMGEKTKDMVQGLSDEVGPSDFDVQSKLKLAKVTPQGDNWLNVRSVNACQACHDSNVWLSGGDSISGVNMFRDEENGTEDPNDPDHQLDKYMAFYSDKYSGVGFDWLGKKLNGPGRASGEQGSAGWIHNTADAGNNGRFTCGSGGGCHGNPDIDSDLDEFVGLREASGFTIAIHEAHLELTRDYILAQRFSIDISNETVAKNDNGKYEFTADVQIIDQSNNNPVTILANGSGGFEADISDAAFDDLKTLGPLLPDGRQMFTGYLAWMNDSPDYNQSAGKAGDDFTEIPGGTVNAPIEWSDGSSVGKVTVDLESVANNQWATLKDNLNDVVGTLVIRGSLGDFPATIDLTTATKDFRFDNKTLANNEGRRKVVDFTFGNGPVNLAPDSHYDDWDKEDGPNTQSCSSCHLQLSMHAGVTNNVQACVTCHNPQRTDINSRTVRGTDLDDDGLVKLGVDGQYEESLDLKRLVHAIHASGDGFREDQLTMYGLAVQSMPGELGNSFPGQLSNCQSCHVEDETSGKWTFELDQLPEGMIGSSVITADWSKVPFQVDGGAHHDVNNHLKMSPIASVCSSCHDAGYKDGDGRMNEDIVDGGPYVGSHWWVMGGIAPGVVPPGMNPQDTKHQSGK